MIYRWGSITNSRLSHALEKKTAPGGSQNQSGAESPLGIGKNRS
ncbi:MAG: hypothetical protein SO158_06575 [Bacteroidaceae bacterium]|nr:hypothetical protein [Bacteroidaceae bacterium]MDY4787073.1 hypothetical protein [Bacteroidaceae bacterium]